MLLFHVPANGIEQLALVCDIQIKTDVLSP